MVGVSLLLGATALVALCLAYAWIVASGVSDSEARSFGFSAIVLGNLAMIHATRSRDHSILQGLRCPNPALWWVTAGTVGALLVAVYVPPVADIFRFAPLAIGHFGLAGLTGVAGVLWYELYKALKRRNGVRLT
jgi:Ca2+-transporting ATPase